jgi:SAM-dependent methyltransferase
VASIATGGQNVDKPTDTDGLEAIGAAMAARGRLRVLSAHAQVLALFGAAQRAGWLELLAGGISAGELAERTGAASTRVSDVLAVFASADIVTEADARFTLAPEFSALAAGASGVTADTVLDDVFLQAGRAEAAIRGPGGALDETQALVLARDWGLRPTSGAQAIYAMIYDVFPAVRDRLSQGGPFLDVGSGIGGALLTTLSLFGELHGVGVEVAAAVAKELQDRADAAGLADRVQIRQMDARELRDEQRFAVAFWAQEFFDASARADTLAVIFRALRPGGLLLLQELSPEPPDDDHKTEWLLDRMFYRGLGATFGVTAEDLAAEATAAGFAHDITAPTPAGRMVLLHRP